MVIFWSGGGSLNDNIIIGLIMLSDFYRIKYILTFYAKKITNTEKVTFFKWSFSFFSSIAVNQP